MLTDSLLFQYKRSLHARLARAGLQRRSQSRSKQRAWSLRSDWSSSWERRDLLYLTMCCQKEEPRRIFLLSGNTSPQTKSCYSCNIVLLRPPSLEYEVMRVEGSEETSPDSNLRKARKAKRRSESPLRVSDSPTKMKKLKLVLGSETMSTVNYSE